jgi:CHAT domain-containing protein
LRNRTLALAGKDADHAGFHLTLENLHDNPALRFRNVDLLTFSASETAVGVAGDGREVEGLTTIALQSGAKAVIASLWDLNDSSASVLMSDFYRRWRDGQGETTKAEALREAQLDLLHGNIRPSRDYSGPAGQEGYAHPYYWASYVLTGNWR